MSTLPIPKSSLVARINWISETVITLQKKPVIELRESVWLDWAKGRLSELTNNLTLGIYGSK